MMKIMDLMLKIMDFILKIMNFILKVMDFILKLMDSIAVLHEGKRHGHTPATCTIELPSEEIDISSSHHHLTIRWAERYGLHPWKAASGKQR